MLVVKVSERQPMYVWCGYSAPAPVQPGSVGEQCLYSDETGYLYAPAPTFSGTPYIKLYGGIATGTPAAGAHYLASSTPGSFGSSLSFVSAISGVDFFSAAFKPLALIAKDDKNRNEFEVVTISGARVLFTLDQDIQRSIEAFRRVVTAEKLSSQPIDYIDLRYGNKVYYKIR